MKYVKDLCLIWEGSFSLITSQLYSHIFQFYLKQANKHDEKKLIKDNSIRNFNQERGHQQSSAEPDLGADGRELGGGLD